MLIGDRQSAVNARALINAGRARLEPRLLTDGTYALPEEVRTDPAYTAAVSTISSWSTGTPDLSAYVPIPDPVTLAPEFLVQVNNKLMYHGGRQGSLTMPDPAVFRFQIQANDFAASTDSANQNRRSELIAAGPNRGIGASTAWSAFCLILGDHPGLTKVRSGPLGLVNQWHSVDTSIARSPVLGVDCSNNVMSILTRSSASLSGGDGVAVTRYSTSIPVKGGKTYFVLQATFGSSGHLNAWINGTQVVNVDCPIGYYTDLTDGSGRTELGYPHWGLYTRNQSETDIVYIANPEWGTVDLSSRISAPLAVPDLTW
jgi:hypothetical protein